MQCLDERTQYLTRRQALRRSGGALIAVSTAGTSSLTVPQLVIAQSNDDAGAERAGNGQRKITSQTVSTIEFRDNAGKETSVAGRVLVRATDGGLLVEDAARRLWTIPASQLKNETVTDQAFQLFDSEQLGRRLVEETRAAGIDTEFHIHTTDNYVIAASTPEACSQWTSQLLERMQIAFQSYWQNRHFELHPLASPLPVLILSNQTQFAKMAEFDRTPASAKGQGYYLVTANRIVLFDLTAQDATSPATTIVEVQRRVEKVPASVATVVHEATHQIAFNRGMHCRYADNPVWLTEGMAMYFETPDLKSRRGWSGIGKVNDARLFRFREFLKARRGTGSIESLIRDNSRFAEADRAIDAYSEAWALSYFLIRTRIRDYSQYLNTIAQKQPLQWDTPEERVAEFRSAFGDDLAKLDRELVSFTSRLK
ncbi:MAG: DUF1570 domain-containing protein [Rhodopirellula sp.]|nr:DUF1570 domain-containing protein [Rhodopirellula sp.]